MGWHGSRYITAQHILDQSDDLVESDFFTENNPCKIWEALRDSADILTHRVCVYIMKGFTSVLFAIDYLNKLARIAGRILTCSFVISFKFVLMP